MFYKIEIKNQLKLFEDKKCQLKEIQDEAEMECLNLYSERKESLNELRHFQDYLATIKNVPGNITETLRIENIKCEEFRHAVNKEKEFESSSQNMGAAVGGAAIGVAIAEMGADAAMAVATALGTTSTGVAISSLSGAAASNAALAWLGGGALAAGGGGISAGSAFLALAGPVGWSIAGVAIVGSGLFAIKKNKRIFEDIQKEIKDMENDIAILSAKLTELKQLIIRTSEVKKQIDCVDMMNYFPDDYLMYDDSQKEILMTKMINISVMTTLLNQRIY